MSNAEELLGRRRVASAHCLVGSEHVAWMRWGCHSRDVGEQSQSPTAGVAAGMQVGAAEGPHDRPKWQQLLRAWGRDFCHTHYQSSAGAGGLLQAFGIASFCRPSFPFWGTAAFLWTELNRSPKASINTEQHLLQCGGTSGPRRPATLAKPWWTASWLSLSPFPLVEAPQLPQVPPHHPGGGSCVRKRQLLLLKAGGGFQSVCSEQSEPSSASKAVLTRSGSGLLAMTASDCRCC